MPWGVPPHSALKCDQDARCDCSHLRATEQSPTPSLPPSSYSCSLVFCRVTLRHASAISQLPLSRLSPLQRAFASLCFFLIIGFKKKTFSSVKYICCITSRSGVHFVIRTGSSGASLSQRKAGPLHKHLPLAKVHSHTKGTFLDLKQQFLTVAFCWAQGLCLPQCTKYISDTAMGLKEKG